MNTPILRMEEENRTQDYIIGLLLAITSCIFIGSSFIIKKKGLLRLSLKGGVRAGAGGYGYLKDSVWWAGLLTMGIGEAANFVAYAFAPASLVTPLGALSILVSAILASKFLDEHLNIIGKLGCMLCIMGSVIVVIHAPKEGEVKSSVELQTKILESGFLYYIILVVAATIFIVIYVVPRYGNTHVIVYVFICSIIGSLSVMCCKGIGLGVREAVDNLNAVNLKSIAFFLISLIVCITVQMNYLNKALDIFHTSIVNPIHYVLFTSSVILASSILFQEWRRIHTVDILATSAGFVVVIIAIFMLNAFRDMNVSLIDLYRSSSRIIN